MCQLFLYWSAIVFSSVILAVGTAYLTVARVNLLAYNVYSESESDAIPELTFWLILIGLVALFLANLLAISNWAIKRKKRIKSCILAYGHVVLATACMIFGITVGLEIANVKFTDQSQALDVAYKAEVALRQQALANVPFQCEAELAQTPSAWALEPCGSCSMTPSPYVESHESIWVISREVGGNDYDTWTYLTRQEPLDAVVCQSAMANWSPVIWSSFSTININETVPQCLNVPLDFETPLGQALMGYTGLYQAWVPMQTTATEIPSSTDSCVRVQGWISRRFYLTSICGVAEQGLPNPLQPALIPAQFNCTSPQLAEFQATYRQLVLQLNASIANVPPPFVYDQTPLSLICGTIFGSIIVLVILLVVLMGTAHCCVDDLWPCCLDLETSPLLDEKNDRQKLYPSIN